MTINITIEETSQHASVLLTKDGKVESKKISLPSLFETFNSLISAEKDTGYVPSSLLREVVKNTVCRAFYFKEFITDFKYTSRRDNIRPNNKYNITIVTERSTDTRYILIPNFKFTNILGFISNSNTEAFNPSFYQIFSVCPNIFGTIDDSSKLVRFFPNQFDDHICWANTFNKDVLKSRDIQTQSTFVTQYLTSKFNTDLFRHKLMSTHLTPYSTELDEFLMEVTNKNYSDLYSNDEVLCFYLTYYFLVTIKNIEPATIANDAGTLGNLFNRRM